MNPSISFDRILSVQIGNFIILILMLILIYFEILYVYSTDNETVLEFLLETITQFCKEFFQNNKLNSNIWFKNF